MSQDELDILNSNGVFQKHVAAGHIKVMAKRSHPDKVALDMNGDDPSRPRTPADYKPEEEPTTGTDKPKGLGKKTK